VLISMLRFKALALAILKLSATHISRPVSWRRGDETEKQTIKARHACLYCIRPPVLAVAAIVAATQREAGCRAACLAGICGVAVMMRGT